MEWQRGEEMREPSLTDGWASYYTAGRTCHLLLVACLLLPPVASCFFYDGDYRADAWTNSSAKDSYRRSETHVRPTATHRLHSTDTARVGSGESHWEKLGLSGLLWDLVCPW